MNQAQSLDSLRRHIVGLLDISDGCAFSVACGILEDPQAHIDALLEAGVLEFAKTENRLASHGPNMTVLLYAVVQPEPPHEHSWQVVECIPDHVGQRIKIACFGCRAERLVSKDLPIEIPK